MKVLLDTSHDLAVCEQELGCECEQLLTPLTRFRRQREGERFAIDNGCFGKGDISAWLALLEREKRSKQLCRFVTLPDIVANARRTLELFEVWRYRMELSGWPLALVAQDGQEGLPIPWEALSAIFIGGSTGWKLGQHAKDIIKTANLLGIWVHVGRVNTEGRFEMFESLGVDSIDGTGIARYSYMREAIYRAHNEPHLFSEMQVTQ